MVEVVVETAIGAAIGAVVAAVIQAVAGVSHLGYPPQVAHDFHPEAYWRDGPSVSYLPGAH